jgi:hypothetical protein
MEIDPALVKGLTIAIGALGPALGIRYDWCSRSKIRW